MALQKLGYFWRAGSVTPHGDELSHVPGWAVIATDAAELAATITHIRNFLLFLLLLVIPDGQRRPFARPGTRHCCTFGLHPSTTNSLRPSIAPDIEGKFHRARTWDRTANM